MKESITVVAAVLRREHSVLITRRREGTHLGGFWEFPGGKVEPGEDLEDALKRELLEEIGVSARVIREVLEASHQYPERLVRIHFFECEIESGEPGPLQVSDLSWVPVTELSSYDFPEADRDLIRLIVDGKA